VWRVVTNLCRKSSRLIYMWEVRPIEIRKQWSNINSSTFYFLKLLSLLRFFGNFAWILPEIKNRAWSGLIRPSSSHSHPPKELELHVWKRPSWIVLHTMLPASLLRRELQRITPGVEGVQGHANVSRIISVLASRKKFFDASWNFRV
jgi:hypothetical protein